LELRDSGYPFHSRKREDPMRCDFEELKEGMMAVIAQPAWDRASGSDTGPMGQPTFPLFDASFTTQEL
jgi:hypothetical protein